jgi:hypothetical protein
MTRPDSLRRRFWVEAGLASLAAVLMLLTSISPEWIEIVFGIEPDHGSGAFEWALVAGLAAITIVSGLLARTEWRRTVRV